MSGLPSKDAAAYILRKNGLDQPLSVEKVAQAIYRRGWSWGVVGEPGALWVEVATVLNGERRAIGHMETSGYNMQQCLVQVYAMALEWEAGK